MKKPQAQSIFDYENYKDFILDTFSKMPKGGYGQFLKLAIYLRINAVTITQVLRGDRDFSLEQALEISEYLGLTELETDYFLNLVQSARAGTEKLRRAIAVKLERQRTLSQQIKKRVPSDIELSPIAQAQFYSDWKYSAIRLSSSIKGLNSLDSLATQFGLSKKATREIVDFLLQHGLCINKDGKLTMGVQSTHLTPESPFLLSHHRNWRIKALEKMSKNSSDDLFYSGPMTLSKDLAIEIRKNILSLLEGTIKKVISSPSEELRCFSIDWFKV